MIVSFLHNYIYLRPKKTGSSTIEHVLSKDVGPEDIIAGKKAGRIPGIKNVDNRFAQLDTHTKATNVKTLVPEQFWSQAYKISSARHPYEKAVSLAYYRWHKFEKWGVEDEEKQFSRILYQVVRSNAYHSFKYYSIDGEVIIDDFIRHESFEADLRRVAARIGIAVPDELPKKKQGLRLDPRPASEILSDQQKGFIVERCKAEFELLGYKR